MSAVFGLVETSLQPSEEKSLFKSLPARATTTVEVQCGVCGIILHLEPVRGEHSACVCGHSIEQTVSQAA
ncbi:MAG: hypothetical protein VKO21_00365 [Candidatus Sericytochromatia bacterium]|nr:hypothetical protein [Candidatus Sericytochromatia bacterium]